MPISADAQPSQKEMAYQKKLDACTGKAEGVVQILKLRIITQMDKNDLLQKALAIGDPLKKEDYQLLSIAVELAYSIPDSALPKLDDEKTFNDFQAGFLMMCHKQVTQMFYP